jgi:hypothetical protein
LPPTTHGRHHYHDATACPSRHLHRFAAPSQPSLSPPSSVDGENPPHPNPKFVTDEPASCVVPVSGEVLASPPPPTSCLRRPHRWQGLHSLPFFFPVMFFLSGRISSRPVLTGPAHTCEVCDME